MPTGDHSSLHDELHNDAASLGAAARSRVHSAMGGGKGMAARQVKSAVTVLEAAAGGLDDDSPEWLRSALRNGSTALLRMADSVDAKSSKDLLDDVQRMARSNPTLFLGLCAVAGFAAVRVIKASAQPGGDGSDSDDASARHTPKEVPSEPVEKPAKEPAANAEYRAQAGYGRAAQPAGADKLSRPQGKTD